MLRKLLKKRFFSLQGLKFTQQLQTSLYHNTKTLFLVFQLKWVFFVLSTTFAVFMLLLLSKLLYLHRFLPQIESLDCTRASNLFKVIPYVFYVKFFFLKSLILIEAYLASHISHWTTAKSNISTVHLSLTNFDYLTAITTLEELFIKAHVILFSLGMYSTLFIVLFVRYRFFTKKQHNFSQLYLLSLFSATSFLNFKLICLKLLLLLQKIYRACIVNICFFLQKTKLVFSFFFSRFYFWKPLFKKWSYIGFFNFTRKKYKTN